MVMRARLQAVAGFIAVLTSLLIVPRAAAQRPLGAPFQVGGTYRLVYQGAAVNIRVLAPPDANGMVAATLLAGLGDDLNGQQVWVNVRLAVVVLPADAQSSGGAAPTGDTAPPVSNPYAAQLRADLRNLVTAEESFFADSIRYTSALRSLGYRPSAGVTVTILGATDTSWSATATHVNLPGYVCGIFVGSATAPIAGQNEGEPVCVRR